MSGVTGARNACASSAKFSLMIDQKPAKLKFNVLEKGSGPVLFGIDALRGLGAIVDYGNDQVIYAKAAPDKLQTLERSQVGHLLIDLTEDLVSGAEKIPEKVVSLKQLANASSI